MGRSWRTIAIVMLAMLAASVARAENKLAFVVGIDAYPHLGPEAQLQRAVTDAESVGDALAGLGFRVTRVTAEASADAILNAFDAFTHEIEPGDTVVFYYAGHGISFDDGNYLVPADVPALGPADERVAKRHAIAERDIKQSLRGAGARVVVVVLDACRNNPFSTQGTRSLGAATRGLARIEATNGIFSLYSAREGQTALDRLSDTDPDKNSVFTRVFLKDLQTPGLSLSELGDAVRDDVASLARGAHVEQVPAVSNDLVGARQVFLAGSAKAVAPPTSPAPAPAPSAPVEPPADQVAWRLIKGTSDPGQIETFLTEFPQTSVRAEAEARLAALHDVKVPASTAPETEPPERGSSAPERQARLEPPPPLREPAPAASARALPRLPPAAFVVGGLDPNGDNFLAVRAGPSASAPMLRRLPPGTPLVVDDRSGAWAYVSLPDGASGWVHARYVLPTAALPAPAYAPPPPATPVTAASYAFVTGLDPYGDNFLALKAAPDVRSARLAKMGPGTRLRIVGRSGDWVRVETLDGASGWASSHYIGCCVAAR